MGRGCPPGGELVVYRELYEQASQEREQAQAKVRDLELDLVAIANAGPIRPCGFDGSCAKRSQA